MVAKLYPTNEPYEIPCGKHESIESYFVSPPGMPPRGGVVAYVYHPTEIALDPPKTIEPSHHWHCHGYIGSQMRLAETFVAHIPRLRVINIDDHLGLVAPDNYLLFGVDNRQTVSLFQKLFEVDHGPNLQHFDGMALVGAGRHTSNYFHWLYSLLPLFSVAAQGGVPMEKLDALVVARVSQQFQIEMLKALPFELPVLQAASYPNLRLRDAIVIGNPGDEFAPYQWKIDFLRGLFLKTPASPSACKRRVYITRNGARRNLSNEPEIIAALERRGFECLALDGKTVVEQAQIFSEAEVVVALHGSALGNIIFCHPGATVIDYFRPFASMCRLNYHYVIGDGQVANVEIPALIHKNFSLSVSKLERTLDQAGIR